MHDGSLPPDGQSLGGRTDTALLEQTLGWLRGARRPHAWTGLLELAPATHEAGMAPAQMAALWRAAGRRWAARHPLPACKTLDEAERAINTILAEAALGWVHLSAPDRAIEIEHREPPVAEGAAEALLLMLEGLYTAWIQGLGANPAFTARLASMPTAGRVHLAFGLAEEAPAQAVAGGPDH
jgi:hypothetical protein